MRKCGHRRVEGLRRVNNLQPRRDSADARDVGLHDRATASRQIFAEMADGIKRLADGNRRGGGIRQPHVPVDVIGGQWLLDPGKIELGKLTRAPDRIVEREPLVGVGHDLEIVAERRAHRREPCAILRDMRAANLDLGAAKPLFARRKRIFNQGLRRQMQPTTLGRVERPPIARATRGDPQRQAAPLATQIPKRGIDRRQRERRNGADGCGVGGEFQIAPDRFYAVGVLPEDARRQMIGQQPHHRGAAGADGVGIADADGAVAIGDRDDRRLLRDKALDGVGSLHLRRQINHAKFDAFDFRHLSLPRARAPRRLRHQTNARRRGRS